MTLGIDFQGPLRGMADNLSDHCVVSPAHRDGAGSAAFCRQQRHQVAGDGDQPERRGTGLEVTVRQTRASEIAARLSDAVLRTFAALVIPVHHLAAAEAVLTQTGFLSVSKRRTETSRLSEAEQ